MSSSQWVKVKVSREDLTAIVNAHAEKAGSHNATVVLHYLANQARRLKEERDGSES